MGHGLAELVDAAVELGEEGLQVVAVDGQGAVGGNCMGVSVRCWRNCDVRKKPMRDCPTAAAATLCGRNRRQASLAD